MTGLQSVRSALAILAVIGVGGLAGCATTETVTKPATATIGVDHRADPASFEGNPGDLLAIELPFRAGTGYAWQASGFDPAVIVEAGTDERRATPGESVGAAMIATISFDLVAKGETTILLERRRPWEKDAPPAESRRVRVTVR